MWTQSLPLQIKATHICFGSSGPNIYAVMRPVVAKLMNKHYRLRHAFHSGLNAELAESLRPYGLTKECLHCNIGGTYTDGDYLSWLQQREAAEVATQMQRNDGECVAAAPCLGGVSE
jgi:hypothetical protein